MRIPSFLLLIFPLAGFATTLPDLSYDRLVSLSDTVVVGEITGARFGGTSELPCSAIYDVRITRVVSGPVKIDQVITVGPYSGMELGSGYLFFLGKTESAKRLIASTNSLAESDENAREKRCAKTTKPEYAVLMEGVGALKITDTYDTKGAGGIVHFPPLWIVPPERVKVTESPFQATTWGKEKLVSLDELVK